MPLTGYGVDDTQYMEDYHSPGHSVLHFNQYVIKPGFHHSGLNFNHINALSFGKVLQILYICSKTKTIYLC